MFRGHGEPIDAPRAWWRMTARPLAGFIGAGVFLAQAIATSTATTESASVTVFVVLCDLVVMSSYLNSSLRLIRLIRTRDPGPQSHLD